MAKHTSIRTVDHLSKLIRSLSPEDNMASKLKLHPSKAVEKLPTELDALIEQTYFWFSHSAEHQGTNQTVLWIHQSNNLIQLLLSCLPVDDVEMNDAISEYNILAKDCC
uniref:Uncharacterized protein n=1 Tax=Romanomermis culicivorax TaxID=13658 RepID=A0A915J6N2_ROMCU